MKAFLGRHPDDDTLDWKEWQLQAYCIQQARREGYMVAGGMEAARRTKAQAGIAKATGLTAGEPDMRFYFPPPTLITFIELKGPNTPVSKTQVEYHNTLKSIGHTVHVVKEKTPLKSWDKIKSLLPPPPFKPIPITSTPQNAP
jgi:hypothetical protein